ncbi:MAG: transketolase family protein [Lachnospiraceae bacterium]|jgi:transketolase|nr:transketolase family protein [Lachnospiraceae bacterium]MCI1328313.1 transketolase family protein [Lachnospiraceae bacterium]
MSDSKKIATRESYGHALVELGAAHENVVVMDADVAGATKTGMFRDAYPDRFFDSGIAEANMMAAAAGMSTLGLVPFVSSFAMFAAGRAFEQVRNSIGYPHLNVKICATHGGLSVGPDGATHQCCEDFGLMRTIPGMTVMCPADDIEAKKMIFAAYETDGPVYIRFGRFPVPVFHSRDDSFTIGHAETLREGDDVAIIANGIMVSEALAAAKQLQRRGISARVINMATIKPLDVAAVARSAKECGAVVTAEEHNICGGLGDAVASAICETHPVPLLRIGVMDRFGESGSAEQVLKRYGLTAENIASRTEEFVKNLSR